MIRQNYAVLFTTVQALVAALVKSHSEGRLEERLAFLVKPKFLMVDALKFLRTGTRFNEGLSDLAAPGMRTDRGAPKRGRRDHPPYHETNREAAKIGQASGSN